MSPEAISDRPNPPGLLECPAYKRSLLPNRLPPPCGQAACPTHGDPRYRPPRGRLGDDVTRYLARQAATDRLRRLAHGRRLTTTPTGRPLAYADATAARLEAT